MKELADRVDERSLFQGLLAGNPARRIVLLQGPLGTGKTSLLNHLGGMADAAGVSNVFLDFAGGPPLASIINLCAAYLPDGIIGFSGNPIDAPKTGDLNVSLKDARIGSHSNVEVTLNTGYEHMVAMSRQAELMRALKGVNRKIVFLIDNGHCATSGSPLAQFVALLGALCVRNPNVSLVVAGEGAVQPSSCGASHVECFTLGTIVDSKHWMNLALAVEPNIPLEPLRTLLIKLCEAARSSPQPMNVFIMTVLLCEISTFRSLRK